MDTSRPATVYESIINSSKDFITLINRDFIYELVNESYCSNIGRSKADILNCHVSEVWGPERFEQLIRPRLQACFAGEEVHYVEHFSFGEDKRYMHVSYYPFNMGDGVSHAIVFSHDISKIKEIEGKLTHFEYRDPVTGLFNRRSLDIILEMELEKAKRSETEKERALLVIGLNNISRIKEVFGLVKSDILLENTGLRIKNLIRQADYAFRMEGDELVVLLTRVRRDTDAARVAEKILNSITIPYRHGGKQLSVSANVGVSIYPGDGDDLASLMCNALIARNAARLENKPILLYDRGLHDKAMNRLFLESEIQRAFEEHQFTLHYQPICDAAGVLLGAEALIRWMHPERGNIPPNDFIPLLEELGKIHFVGKWALYQVCEQLRRWGTSHSIYVSMNVSVQEFLDGSFVDTLKGAISKCGSSPCRLKIEVTESEGMQDPERSIKVMQQITELGLGLYIDDFGTGHSSLSYLNLIPAEVLKLDKIFIDHLEEDPKQQKFVEGIINMVGSMEKEILCEGVESREQVDLLHSMGCRRFQGYYFSKPLTAEAFEEVMKMGKVFRSS
jgi:diguanylate cyclase (GGDEF)-like protein/PAS domain S-box-containing protein